MNLDSVRAHCMSFPHATEQIQWGDDLLFKVAGKMFAVMPLEPAPVVLSFKCTDEKFAELVELDGVIPAPYMARNKWIALERFDALPSQELMLLLRESYDLVFAKLPNKTKVELISGPLPRRSEANRKRPRRKKRAI